MLVGNKSAQDLLKKIWNKLKESLFAQFFLVEGPWGIGKTTFVKNLVINPLISEGLVHEADVLFLEDLTKITGKFHPIKVDEEQQVKVEDSIFYFLGTRQVSQWAYLRPILKYKILLVQNMERMTTSAANAFLKLLEEPPSYLLIWATTTSRSKLLDTIVSRAFLIKMYLIKQSQIKEFLKNNYSNLTQEQATLISDLSQGSIAAALEILQFDYQELIKLVKNLKELLGLEGYYKEKILLLQEFFGIMWINKGLDIIAAILAQLGNNEGVKNIINIKSRNTYWLDATNINFLLYLVLSIEKSDSKKI